MRVLGSQFRIPNRYTNFRIAQDTTLITVNAIRLAKVLIKENIFISLWKYFNFHFKLPSSFLSRSRTCGRISLRTMSSLDWSNIFDTPNIEKQLFLKIISNLASLIFSLLEPWIARMFSVSLQILLVVILTRFRVRLTLLRILWGFL